MDFLVNGRIETRDEPWNVFTVYGNFEVNGKNFIIVRIPTGRVPWARRIAPAINRLVRQWYHLSPTERDIDGRFNRVFWNVEGEPTVVEAGNFYHPSGNAIPESKRLWDYKNTLHFEWNGTALVEVA